MILLIDNYDSFVFNLERYVRRLGVPTRVERSDQVQLDHIADGHYSAVILSPGPKAPAQAGRSLEVVKRFHTQVPILGVCLGHQVICQALGGKIIRAPRAVHGQSSPIEHQQSRLFAGLPSPFQAARYHSLIAERSSLPTELRGTGMTARVVGENAVEHPPIVMSVEHVELPVFGVQFHPESILSDVGYRILANFLEISGLKSSVPLPRSDFASDDVWNGFLQTRAEAAPVGQLEQSGSWPPTVLPTKVPVHPKQPAP